MVNQCLFWDMRWKGVSGLCFVCCLTRGSPRHFRVRKVLHFWYAARWISRKHSASGRANHSNHNIAQLIRCLGLPWTPEHSCGLFENKEKLLKWDKTPCFRPSFPYPLARSYDSPTSGFQESCRRISLRCEATDESRVLCVCRRLC